MNLLYRNLTLLSTDLKAVRATLTARKRFRRSELPSQGRGQVGNNVRDDVRDDVRDEARR